MPSPFRQILESEPELRGLLGSPGEVALAKQRATLDDNCRMVIAHSPYVLVGTSNASGRCDVSPRGDAPGFVFVVDDTHLVIPDRPGNRRLDGMRNILENNHVGLLFLVPGREETLRVNGRAWLVTDEELMQRTAAQGKYPAIAVGVEVEEVFLQCGKASLRSHLWRPEQWPDTSQLPSAACMLVEHTQLAGMTVDQMERRLSDDRRRLY